MFISSGIHAPTHSGYPARGDDDDMSSVSSASSSIDLHNDHMVRVQPGAAERKTPIPLPAPAIPQIDALKTTPTDAAAGPWEERPIKDLESLTTVQEVYTRAMEHSPRHARKVLQAVLVNGAGAGVLAQQANTAVCANKALNIGALMLKQFVVDLAQTHPDRFQQEVHNLFFNLLHPPHFDDCFQFGEACTYQGVLAGMMIAGLAKIPPQTKGLEKDKLRIVTDAFGVHINSVLGHSRLFQRHMPVLWPAGRSFAKAQLDPKTSAREHVFRFVATLEDFMIASNIYDAREFNAQMLKTLRHCLI